MGDLTEHEIIDDEDPSVWAICGEDGVITLCSTAASEHGVISGVTSAWELIDKKNTGIFQDALEKCCRGGDVSVTMETLPDAGFEIAKVRGVRLFSSFGAEIQLYRNKDEYLAASTKKNERFGRVFDYVNIISSAGDSLLADSEKIPELPSAFGKSLFRIARLSELMMANIESQGEICDVSGVFDMIADYFDLSSDTPFTVEFDNCLSGTPSVCGIGTEGFMGIVLTAVAVASRLASNRTCHVKLLHDGGFVMLETECRLRREHHLYGRSDDFRSVYRCIPAAPAELMLFEQMVSVFDWSAEYSANEDGSFILRAAFMRNADPDRLKYRDSTKNVPLILREFSDYAKDAFLPDSQQQREY